MDDFRKFLLETLPKNAHKHIDAVVAHVAGLIPDAVTTVEMHHARVPVETVEAYGLKLRLDASGNAVTVTFPYGAEVIE